MQTKANKTAVQMRSVTPAPFITNDEVQKAPVTHTSRYKNIHLWGKITVAEHTPHAVSFGKIPPWLLPPNAVLKSNKRCNFMDKSVPLWLSISRKIEADIAAGKYAVGDVLPIHFVYKCAVSCG